MSILTILTTISNNIGNIASKTPFSGSLPATESVLSDIQTSLELLAFDGQLPGTETALTGLRGDIQATTAALNCVCQAIQELNANNVANYYLPDPATAPAPMPTAPTAPTPPAETGHTDWDSYLCGAGALLCDAIAGLADEIGGLSAAGILSLLGLITAIGAAWGVVTHGAGLIPVVGVVAGLWGAIIQVAEGGLDAVMSNISNQFRNNTNLRNCVSTAVKNGDGWEGKKALVLQAIDSKFSGLGLELAKLMVLDIWMQEIVNGRDVDGVAVFPTTPVGVPCDCLDDCSGGTANISISWTFPTSTTPVGDYADDFDYIDRAPTYDADNQATILRQGGSGYQPTEIHMLLNGLEQSNWTLVCVQILAKFDHSSSSVGAAQGFEPVKSLEPGMTSEYSWYNISPSSTAMGTNAHLANTSGSSTTSYAVRIKQIIWRFSS